MAKHFTALNKISKHTWQPCV